MGIESEIDTLGRHLGDPSGEIPTYYFVVGTLYYTAKQQYSPEILVGWKSKSLILRSFFLLIEAIVHITLPTSKTKFYNESAQ